MADPTGIYDGSAERYVRELYTKIHNAVIIFWLSFRRAILARCLHGARGGRNSTSSAAGMMSMAARTVSAAPSRAFYAILDCACR